MPPNAIRPDNETYVQSFLTLAQTQVNVTEQPIGSNRGKKVEEYLAQCGLAYTQKDQSYPWCAAFVARVGFWTLGNDWPMKFTASCDSERWTGLWQEGQRLDIVADTPNIGAIFLRRDRTRFGHTGICVRRLEDGRWETIEGNTNSAGVREGWGVFRRQRRFKEADAFLYWWEAL